MSAVESVSIIVILQRNHVSPHLWNCATSASRVLIYSECASIHHPVCLDSRTFNRNPEQSSAFVLLIRFKIVYIIFLIVNRPCLSWNINLWNPDMNLSVLKISFWFKQGILIFPAECNNAFQCFTENGDTSILNTLRK